MDFPFILVNSWGVRCIQRTARFFILLLFICFFFRKHTVFSSFVQKFVLFRFFSIKSFWLLWSHRTLFATLLHIYNHCIIMLQKLRWLYAEFMIFFETEENLDILHVSLISKFLTYIFYPYCSNAYALSILLFMWANLALSSPFVNTHLASFYSVMDVLPR